MQIDPAIISIVSLIISLGGFLLLWLKFIVGIKEDIKRLQTQIEPFWKMVEMEVPRILHSPHTPETDRLLEQLENGCKLTLDQIRELKNAIVCSLRSGQYSTDKMFPAALLVKRLEMLEEYAMKDLGCKTHIEVKKCTNK